MFLRWFLHQNLAKIRKKGERAEFDQYCQNIQPPISPILLLMSLLTLLLTFFLSFFLSFSRSLWLSLSPTVSPILFPILTTPHTQHKWMLGHFKQEAKKCFVFTRQQLSKMWKDIIFVGHFSLHWHCGKLTDAECQMCTRAKTVSITNSFFKNYLLFKLTKGFLC